MKHKIITTLTIMLTIALTHAQWLLQPYEPNEITAPEWTTTQKTLLNPHATATIHTHNNIIHSIRGTYTTSTDGINAISALISIASAGTTAYQQALTEHLPTNPPATIVNQFLLTIATNDTTNQFTLQPIRVPNENFRKTRHTTGDPNGILIRIYIDTGCLECTPRIRSALNNLDTHPTPKRIEYHHAPVVSREIGIVSARAIECVTAANPNATRYWTDILDNQTQWINAGATNTAFLQVALRSGYQIEGVNACIDDPNTLLEVTNATEAARQLGVTTAITVFVDGIRMMNPTDVTELNRLTLLALPDTNPTVILNPPPEPTAPTEDEPINESESESTSPTNP